MTIIQAFLEQSNWDYSFYFAYLEVYCMYFHRNVLSGFQTFDHTLLYYV